MKFKEYTDSEVEQHLSKVNGLIGKYGGENRVYDDLMPVVEWVGKALTPTLVVELMTDDDQVGKIGAGLGGAVMIGLTTFYAALMETGNEDAANQAIDYIVKDENNA